MSEGIAIVGMACRYAGARTPAELWENALAGRREFRRIPAERLRLEDYHLADPMDPDGLYSSEAAVLEGWEFDRVRFRVAGSTFRSADLAHWLALEIAAQALADAGFPEGEGLPRDETGVLLGNSLTGEFSRANLMRLRWPYVRRTLAASLTDQGWEAERIGALLARLEAEYKAPFPPTTEESLAGGLSNTIAGRICNHFDLHGGGYTLDGACASSLLAVANACSGLAVGDLDAALAGGVDLSLDPFELVGFARTGALAPEEMRVFDARSAGFVPGEGCGFVVLMREADAVRRGCRIYAVIRGWGISSDGNGGISRPEPEGQRMALRRAYRRAGFGIDTVGYFEGHGTGTAVGDAAEIGALAGALQESAAGPFKAGLGSIKANIGHTKAAAGVAGLIKASLAVHHQILPPNTGCADPHPALRDAPLRVLERGEVWPAERPLRAGVSAMGFGGINAHLALEGAAGARRRSLAPRERLLLASSQDAELLLFTAPDRTALRLEIDRLAALAPRLSRSEMADLAAALHGRLSTGPARAAVVAATPKELAARLERLGGWLETEDGEARMEARHGVFLGPGGVPATYPAPDPDGSGDPELTHPGYTLMPLQGTPPTNPAPEGRQNVARAREPRAGTARVEKTRPPRLGFLFPGQGSPSHLGQGGALARRFDFLEGLYALAELPDPAAVIDPTDTAVAQPAIVAHSLAGVALLERLGLRGAVAVGHSLGEIAALAWAGACGEEDALRLAAARGRAMAGLGSLSGTMASLGASPRLVAELIAGTGAVIAARNAPERTVISGAQRDIEEVLARAAAFGLATTRLRVSHAFHSPLVATAAVPLAAALESLPMRRLARPVASTVTGERLDPAADLRELLVRQVTEPVRFTDALAAVREEADLWIEVGPGHALTDLAAETLDRPILALDSGGPSVAGLLAVAGAAFVLGAPVDTAALFAERFHRPFDPDRPLRFLASPCEAAAVPEIALPSVEKERIAPPAMISEAVSVHGSPLDVVRLLVAERTELPPSAVREESRLLSDLHLNSISVGQLVGEAARRLGLPPPASPTDYAQATVAQVAAALEEQARLAPAAGAEEPAKAPAGIDTWVRPFTVELVERAAPHPRPLSHLPPSRPPGEGRKEGQDSWSLIASPDHPLRAEMAAALPDLPASGVVLALPPELDEEHAGLFLEAAQAVLTAPQPGCFAVVQHGGGGGGFARTLHLELPQWTVCVLDLPFDAAATGRIRAEIAAAQGYVEAVYDGDVRRVPVLRLLPPAAAAPLPLGPQDVLLVTGGGKGIAAECALDLARATGVRLALLGRSAPESDAELAANLDRMRVSGTEPLYLSADVTDAGAVRAAVARIEETLGPVTAVLHGAGTNAPRLLGTLDEAAFRRTLAPKIHGIDNVLAAVDPDRLRLLVTFGSIIARAGLRGEADYATANEWLALRVERFGREHPACRCLNLEWSVWAGVGMGEKLGTLESLIRQGITPIPPDAGLAALRDLLSRPTPASIVVAGRFGEPPTLAIERPEIPLLRFLEKPRVFYPGVELVVDTEISADTDPYLADHVFRGEPLFAAVLGLEAMAQAARLLTGLPGLPVFENVELQRPVAVPPGRSTTVRVAAFVRDPRRPEIVEVALRDAATGFQSDHFRAVCNLAGTSSAPFLSPSPGGWMGMGEGAGGEGLALDPASDLYGGILFHAGRFRRLRAYRELRATACLAEIAPDGAVPWFGRWLPDELVLGDPGARDAAVHGIQACIPHSTLLPIGVDRVVCGRIENNVPLVLAARERSRHGDEFIYDLEIRATDGDLRERWEGLRLRAVDRSDLPKVWSSALLGPYVERRLQEILPGAGVRVALEAGDAVSHLLAGAAVRHRPDGKPEAGEDGSRQVSVAHAGDLVLAVSRDGRIGCDLEPVAERSAEVWRGLLGEERFRLAERIAHERGETASAAATRVWAAAESLTKAGVPHGAPLLLEPAVLDRRGADAWVLLRSGRLRVGTFLALVRELAGPAALAVLVEDSETGAPS